MSGHVQGVRSWLDQVIQGSTNTSGSLAYRTNRKAIWRGEIPEKYTRLVDLVPGERVLELGAAEGVLALLLAQKKKRVVALELKPDRHEEALRLQSSWRERGINVSRCVMLRGNIKENLHLLRSVDTLVAIRSIYYLRDDLPDVFDAVSRHVPNVVLCGNRNRARQYSESQGNPDNELGKSNYFATLEGMISLLEGCGYAIVNAIADGDPIVVGVKKIVTSQLNSKQTRDTRSASSLEASIPATGRPRAVKVRLCKVQLP